MKDYQKMWRKIHKIKFVAGNFEADRQTVYTNGTITLGLNMEVVRAYSPTRLNIHAYARARGVTHQANIRAPYGKDFRA